MFKNWIELIVIATCLTFAVAISLYHLSFDGYLSLSLDNWNTVWAVSENGLSMMMSGVIAVYAYGAIRWIFRYLFAPYFGLKLIYHFSVYSGIYFLPPVTWEFIWSIIVILMIIIGFCRILTLPKHV